MHTELLGHITLLTFVLITSTMLFGGLVHGTLGLGFPMIATPLLSLTYDVRTAVILTLLPTIAVNLVSVVSAGNWRHSVARFWPLSCYALIGSIAGTLLIANHDPAPYKLVLACLILLYLAIQYRRFTINPLSSISPTLSMLVFGLLAGLAAGATNVMVPVLIIYSLSLGLSKNTMVQVFNMTFLAGKIAQTSVFAYKSLLDINWFLATLPMAALSLVALGIGIAIRDKIPAPLFTRIVKLLLVLMAFLLIAQYGISLLPSATSPAV